MPVLWFGASAQAWAICLRRIILQSIEYCSGAHIMHNVQRVSLTLSDKLPNCFWIDGNRRGSERAIEQEEEKESEQAREREKSEGESEREREGGRESEQAATKTKSGCIQTEHSNSNLFTA